MFASTFPIRWIVRRFLQVTDFTGRQRRRLAVKGKILGLARLPTISDIFTPETILRWHRQLVAREWDTSDKRQPAAGRPVVSQEIIDLVLRFARENPTWRYDRIQGALANLGLKVSDQTVGNILKVNGTTTALRPECRFARLLPAVTFNFIRSERMSQSPHAPTPKKQPEMLLRATILWHGFQPNGPKFRIRSFFEPSFS
jgi:hypothetical protein